MRVSITRKDLAAVPSGDTIGENDLNGSFLLFFTSTIHRVCYRRRDQWPRLALALFCLPLIWLARVVYLLVGAAEGCGGWQGHAYPCAVTGYAMLRYGVGVGVGFLRGVLCVKKMKGFEFYLPYHTCRGFSCLVRG